MTKGFLKSLIISVICGCWAFAATAATSLFSDYGQIQNVQNYSSNPFWSPNSPYNQRLPQPVYVQGADLNTEDCTKVVQSLVSVQCMARDNCKNTSLAEIRPEIMVQLSKLPGNNYVSACAGYLDGIFESYVAQFGNNIPNRQVAFPTATTPNPNINNDGGVIFENPYKKQIPKYQQEILERSNELQELQKQNGAGSEHLSATDFPTTYKDLTFTERVNLAAADYAQYKDMNAYVIPNFQNKEEWCSGKGAGTSECKESKPPKKDDINNNNDNNNNNGQTNIEGVDYVLPWYGILVVQKNSLDDVYNSDKPFISPNYMKQHKAKYFPANSDKALGITSGCTHGNHTANDNDIINLAAHKTMNEPDSFFTGNDYYVYDGEDVYWGTAMLVGEIALALITFGVSAEVEAGMTGAKTAESIAAVGKSVRSVNVAKNATKEVQAAARAAKAATAANKKDVITQLGKVGIDVKNTASPAQLQKIGNILLNARQNTGWVSALVGANKWRLLKNGVTRIVPKAKNIFSNGASIGRTLAIGALAYGGVKAADSFSDTAHDIFISVLKANGYSTATTPITDNPQYKNLQFNSFGLLSADDVQGHENDVSHGTWLQFDSTGEMQLGDAANEAAAFAEAFAEDVRQYNKANPLCDIDIFVVQPVIGDPLQTGTKDIYYLLYTNPTANLRVESHTK